MSHHGEGWLRGRRPDEPHHWFAFVVLELAQLILPWGLWPPPSPSPHPLPPVSSHPGKLTLQPFFASVAVPYFCLQCLPSILLYWRDLQLALLCFQGIDFHKLRLVPIISVGAVMIRLWIISLDHCFPLLHWLGAIHLPPSSGVTDAVKLPLLFTSLLSLLPPPPSQSQTHVTIFICPPLQSSI